MDELPAALERLHKFSQSLNDEDVVDEDSRLTGADLRVVIEHCIVFPGDGSQFGPTD